MLPLLRFISYVLCLTAVAALADPEPLEVPPPKWGTALQFNPVSMILNEGWDITQLQGRENRVSKLNSSEALFRLGRTMSHPVATVLREGPEYFVTSQIIPTSMSAGKAGWIPNYQLHLLGGGFLNQQAEAWYRANGYGSPKLLAFATSAASWILNETSEISASGSDYTTDPVADLLLFDLGGVLLFQSDAVRDFFSRRVEAMNWPLQPTLDPRDGRVVNAGQYYALKFPVPYTNDWKFFYHMGLGNIGGLTRKLGGGHSISVGAGAYARRIVHIDSIHNSVSLAPKLGVFWDHDNSLWASAFYNGQSVQRFTVQVYPTPWTSWPIPWGFWATFGGPRGLGGGVVATWGLGLGASR